MSSNKSSPFYNPLQDPQRLRHLWPMICRCRAHGKRPDVVLDTTRRMYVCKDCRKPWLVNENYVVQCEWCQEYFVIWIYDRNNIPDACNACGGVNGADPNVVTEDFAESYARSFHAES